MNEARDILKYSSHVYLFYTKSTLLYSKSNIKNAALFGQKAWIQEAIHHHSHMKTENQKKKGK